MHAITASSGRHIPFYAVLHENLVNYNDQLCMCACMYCTKLVQMTLHVHSHVYVCMHVQDRYRSDHQFSDVV